MANDVRGPLAGKRSQMTSGKGVAWIGGAPPTMSFADEAKWNAGQVVKLAGSK
jgi:hypothetical protein